MKNIILSAEVDGKKREFELTRAEFDEFLLRFEENELIDPVDWGISGMTLTEVAPPPLRK